MRRILVPLDGTELAASILPDARRLAGPDGELILATATNPGRVDRDRGPDTNWSTRTGADAYLDTLAEALREEGVRVQTHSATQPDAAWAIDTLARLLQVDMIVSATPGRGPWGRLARGSVAWRALAHSQVPVLLRHPAESWKRGLTPPEPARGKILVPLDGSEFAEAALPLAGQLAEEWRASLWLVKVIPALARPDIPYRGWDRIPSDRPKQVAAARTYLQRVATRLPGEVHVEVLVGPSVAKLLIDAVDAWGIADIVMASHGRTGVSRAILGSVADTLIQHLHCAIVVVPPFTAQAAIRTESVQPVETAAAP